MKILITTGLRPKDIGGPAQYGFNLKNEFEKLGYKVRVSSYGIVEMVLPIGLRHFYFFLKIIPNILWANKVITLDTFSVGVPTIMATKLFGVKSIVRVGGDFLWESYINRTGSKVILSGFYKNRSPFNTKERIIFSMTKFLITNVDVLAFNTEWQRILWSRAYEISYNKTIVIQNFIPKKELGAGYVVKNFLWVGRDSMVKNLDTLKIVSERIKSKNTEFKLNLVTNLTHKQVLEKIKDCYAVILPSLSDASPNFILEAISFNKPFIVTKETGIGEICPKGGIFINPLDEDDLERAIISMLDSTEYNRFMNELSASSHVNRGWAEVAKDFLNI